MKYLISFCLLMLAFSTSGFTQETPLELGNGKNVGIAIDPVLALFKLGSAEVNFWNLSRSAEINIPIMFARNPFFADQNDIDVTFFSIGAYYRYFFNEKQNGFFAQAGVIHSRASAEDKSNHDETTGSQNSVLFGIGYRLISKKGLFWAVSLGAGKSWGTIKDPNGEEISGSGFTLDMDLLKFGYAW